jgi:hypothetical protein
MDSLFEGFHEDQIIAALSRAAELAQSYEVQVSSLKEQERAAARLREAEFSAARSTASFLLAEVTRGMKDIDDALRSSAGMQFCWLCASDSVGSPGTCQKPSLLQPA